MTTLRNPSRTPFPPPTLALDGRSSDRMASSAASNALVRCRNGHAAGCAQPTPAQRSTRHATPRRRLLSGSCLSVSETFANLKERGKVAFIPYITAGDPDLSTTAEALKVLDACGSNPIELGVPCENPLADGPVIRASAKRALANGATFDRVISMLDQTVPGLSCPIVMLSYYGPILNYGVSKFFTALNNVKVRGLIIPDLPFEGIEAFRMEAVKNNIEMVLMMSPATPVDRMQLIVNASEGFLYLTTHSGATGVRSSINPEVEMVLQNIRRFTKKPISIGFGISKPEEVKQISMWGADGVIVGSAMVKMLGEAKSPREGLRQMEAYTRSLISIL